MVGGRGNDSMPCIEGGCVLAGHEDWRHRLDETVQDCRGWGRYVGKVIRGGRGKQVVVVTFLGPEGETLRKQKELLAAMISRQVKRVVANPKQQFLLDLFDDLFPFWKKGAHLVIGGDFNMKWEKSAPASALFTGLQDFASACDLVHAMEARRYGICDTWIKGGDSNQGSAIDHVLISRPAASPAVLKAAGV